MAKKLHKPPAHVDKHIKSMKTPLTTNSQKLSRPFNISDKHSPSNGARKTSGQPQRKDNIVQFKQAKSTVNGTQKSNVSTVIGESSKTNFNKTTVPKTSTKGNSTTVVQVRNHSQSEELMKHSSSSNLKHMQSQGEKERSNVVTEDSTRSDIETAQACERKKKKKSSRKVQDGASNWLKLCATLNIDATKRKTKAEKRPATSDGCEQGEQMQAKRAKPDIWFDNVDEILLETESTKKCPDESRDEKDTKDPLVKPDSYKGVTNCVAMDCEMVGVGPQGDESILARVSIVNHFGVCLYDKYVKPQEKVTDYRTYVSGVTAEHLATGEEFAKVQSEVSDLIKDRILVGHAVHNDLKVLFLAHPHKMIRDTSRYKPFRDLFNGRLPSLKKLTDKVLGVSVQEGQHSSVQDAQATMRLYTMYRQKWEKELRKERKIGRKKKKKKQASKESV